MIDFEAARVKMVDSQIRTTDVTSHSVLSAFLSVPRELFVADHLKPVAYVDEDLEIAPGRYVMEPSPLAKLLQLAEITKQDRVLEIGTGTGYVAALFARLAGEVVALESDETLAVAAKANLASLHCSNVSVVTGPLESGWQKNSPYDLIFINGAVEEVPEALFAQLREGGRLLAVVGYGHAARATLYVKAAGSVAGNPAFNASVRPLPGFRKAAEFVF
ncbi:protein-L-isoaspartate O-methyltransferase family protein [Rhizobium paknamense]|uniref:Protein-L-isoaspartate O-methyltransferase n=1 Tax=Rhizobium paknamense TaxID=1206817 RepID=A0ABU0IG17_9HYPH|nr:protein-L-isoaspartate O-methyltransferase [Rhizobium paknamense]MDQ0457188.1 protein-L-isoaspartate(D-aspartate) O-methyltransferase [Rhizobium paknamense]